MMRLAVVVFLVCLSAQAHSLSIFASYEGDTLKGRAYSGPHGIANATIQFYDMDHTSLGKSQTDEDGHFQFQPETPRSIECRITLKDGHGARHVVETGDKVHEHPHQEIQPASNGTDIKQLHQQISRLEAMVHEQTHKNGLRDIVGGIGYIMGLAGVVAFFKAKKTA